MGGPMADHVYLAGFDLAVYARSPEKVQRFRSQGIAFSDSLESLGAVCDQVFLCVRTSEDVVQVLEKLTSAARKGTLFVDHSTILPSVAQTLHADLKGRGLRFVDAPVTGGSMGAEKGTLTIFCGGDVRDIEDAMAVMQSYSRRAECVGGPGSGQMMKMANQIAVAGSLLALCESLAFAKKAGLNLAQTRELLSGGAAGSWAFDHYGPKILEEDWSPGFTVDNQLKDLDYCAQAANGFDAAIPGAMLVQKLLQSLKDEGGGHLTTAALFTKLVQLGASA
jgi:3-hydroxyisobutyrate dehydrogenase